MKVNTKLFGEVEVREDKLIQFTSGIIGFNDLERWTLIHEPDKEEEGVLWLQSIDEPEFALPVINPLIIYETYNPIIEDELLKPLGDLEEDNTFVLVTITVPRDITEMTANLKAPIVINTQTRRACQIIVENESYIVKYPIYDVLKSISKKDGD